jgi:hypothetical protein
MLGQGSWSQNVYVSYHQLSGTQLTRIISTQIEDETNAQLIVCVTHNTSLTAATETPGT